MKTIRNTVFAMSLILGMSACKKEVSPDQDNGNGDVPVSIFDLKVKEDFNFKSTSDIQLNVRVQNGNYAGEKFRINVYDDIPTIGNIITSAMVEEGKEVALEFRVPSAQRYLFIQKIASTGASELNRVSVSDYVSTDFKVTTPTLSLKKPSSGLNCLTGCTTTYNNHSSNLNLNNAGVVCLTGNFTGNNINMSGNTTIRFCGTADMNNINMNSNGCKVYFLENSIIELKGINMNNSGANVYNFSDSLKFTSTASFGGSFTNNGKMSVDGNLNVNNNSVNDFINNGDIYVNGHFNNNRNVVNNSYILVQQDYKNNGGATTTNNCRIECYEEFHVNNTFNNNGYVKCHDESYVNGGADLNMNNTSLVVTEDLTFNGNITGASSGNGATIKVNDFTRINGGAVMGGLVELCDSSGVNVNNGTINSPAALACSNYIPTSSCNPAGFGTATIQDADNDGIADNLDDYPNDSTRAFNSYYPNANTFATYGFEDLWPSQGDYDFNDLVLGFRIKKVLNANNDVVELYTDYMVRAIGATFDNGFGVQFDDLSPSDIQTITGQSLTNNLVSLNANNTEAGQNKAVVIFYDSPEGLINRPGGSMFNTIKANPSGNFDSTQVYVKFTNPVAQSKVAMSKWNPFIFVDGTRGVEVHLPDMTPTGKANTSLLGSNQDNSIPSTGRYYKTSNNLPWVIEVPVTFDYPAEKESISDAYNYFNNWAISGGSNYQNWYSSTSGYRDATKVY